MTEEFVKWIESKNLEICDKVNEISHKDTNDSIVLSGDPFKTPDIRVYHSKPSIIQLIVNNKVNDLIKTQGNNVFKWFNDIKLRKQVIQRILDLLNRSTDALQVLEFSTSDTTIKVFKNRVQNLLKCLKYAIRNQIFNYSNETHFKTIKPSIVKMFDSQSFLLKVINEVIPCLISGVPIVLVTDGKAAINASYLLDLCCKAGLESGVIQLVIADNKSVENLTKTTKPLIAPIYAVFESGDIECAIDAIINSYINDTNDSVSVFVQQSIHKKFCEQMRTRLSNCIETGDRLNPNADIISNINVNYDGIDFDNQNKSFDFQVFKFRTNDELKNLINHFNEIAFISLWAEKTSLAIEFATLLTSSSNVYINSSLKYPIKTEICLLDKVVDKMDLKSLSKQQKSIESMIASNNKWKKVSEEQREELFNNYISYESTLTGDQHLSKLQSFNQRIVESKDSNGIQLSITRLEAIGLILIKIGDKFDAKILSTVLEALISGNSVLISGNNANKFPEFLNLKQYLQSSGNEIFHFIDEIDTQLEGNGVLTLGSNVVGLYLQQLDDLCQKSFIKFVKTITLSFGDISFGK